MKKKRHVLVGLGALSMALIIIALIGAAFAPRTAHGQTCRCGTKPDGTCRRCVPVVGGGGGTGGGIIVPQDSGGSGCGTCAEDPTASSSPEDVPSLTRGDDWAIDVKLMFPDRDFQPGDVVTVLLARDFPAAESNLVQPLTLSTGEPALYRIEIGADKETEYGLGKIADNAAGGTYKALAVLEDIGTPQEFWAALQESQSGVQVFGVENVVAIDAAAALVSENMRRLDVPLTIDPDLAPVVDVEFQWSKDGQLLQHAETALQPGIYDTILNSRDQSIMGVYAPWEFIVENALPGLGEQLQLPAYFTSAEYSVEVYVDGILESTETLAIP